MAVASCHFGEGMLGDRLYYFSLLEWKLQSFGSILDELEFSLRNRFLA